MAAVILDGYADHWDAKKVADEFKLYDWHHTTADAVIGVFLVGFVATWTALSRVPVWGLILSTAVCAACAAKRATLEASYSSLRSTCTIVSAVAAALFMLATKFLR